MNNSNTAQLKHLANENMRLFSVLRSTPVAILAVDTHGDVIEWNPKAEELFGLRRSQVIGKYCPLITKNGITRLEQSLGRTIDTRVGDSFNVKWPLPDDPMATLEFFTAPLVAEKGKIVGSIIAATPTGSQISADTDQDGDFWISVFSTALNACDQAVVVINKDFTIEFANHSFLDMLGYSLREVIGQPAQQFDPKSEAGADLKSVLEQVRKNGSWAGYTCHKDKNGRQHNICTQIIGIDDNKGDFVRYVLVETEQESGAGVRPTTDKLNKGNTNCVPPATESESMVLMRELRRALELAKETSTEHVFCKISLDLLEIIRAARGYDAAEPLLNQAMALIRKAARRDAIIAQIEDDKIGVLLPFCSVLNGEAAARKILTVFQHTSFHLQGRRVPMPISIGITVCDEHVTDISEIYTAARWGSETAKAQGGNRFVVAETSDRHLQQLPRQMDLATEVIDSIENNRMYLDWQKIIPLKEASAGLHYEVLARMVDATGKLIPPGKFVPVAERFGLGSQIDRWTVTTTLEWLHRNPRLMADTACCSINLSGQSVGDPTMTDYTIELIDSYAVDLAKKICFELTESSAISSDKAARQFVYSLRQRGCRFALDDFGTGLTSFSYIRNLPSDFIKIDGSFVRDIDTDTINQNLVRSITDVAHSLGRETIAEFVETQAILDILMDLGVDYAQGYHIGKPEPLFGPGEVHYEPAAPQALVI